MHRQTNTYTQLKNKFHPLKNRGWEIKRNRNLTSSSWELMTSVSTWGEFLWQRKSQAEGTKLIEILLKRMYTKMALLFLPFKSSGDITAPGSPHQDHPTKSYREAPEKQSVSGKGKSCLICHGDAQTLVTHRGHRDTREHWHETTFCSVLSSHFCCSLVLQNAPYRNSPSFGGSRQSAYKPHSPNVKLPCESSEGISYSYCSPFLWSHLNLVK